MSVRHLVGTSGVVLFLSVASLGAARSDVADAVMRGDAAAVRALLTQKADVNGTQGDGATALHWAVFREDLATVNLLIQAGANVKVANHEGATPLSLACQAGNARHHRDPPQSGRGSEREASARGNGPHDGVPHRQRRGHDGVARPRRGRQREGKPARHDRADVGRGSGTRRGHPASARARRGYGGAIESRGRRPERTLPANLATRARATDNFRTASPPVRTRAAQDQQPVAARAAQAAAGSARSRAGSERHGNSSRI